MGENKASELFQNRLRQARKKRGMTQAQLAKGAGLTASAISQFESGDREPSFSSLVKLARALEITPSYLAGLEEYALDPEIRALYREQQELSQEDLEVLRTVAAQLKKRSRDDAE